MRILYLNPCGQMGGAEKSLLDLIFSLRNAEPNWELHLVAGENGPLIEKAKELGAKANVVLFPGALARLGDSGNRPLRALWQSMKAVLATCVYALRLRQTVSRIQPDVIHSNGFKMHLLALWSRTGRTPVIWHIRDYVSSRSLMRHLLRLYSKRCAFVIGNSQSVASDVQRVCGPRLQAVCIYNAINLMQYSPIGTKADLDRLSGLEPATEGMLRIGLIASLAHWKGHGTFLRALAQLPAGIQYRAYIIGGPIYQTDNSQQTLQELRILASKHGIADRTGFTGFVADTGSAMRALDIVVHASTEPEPFGRVVAEGLACGRAVIYSASGGTAELVTEGQDALGHPPGDDVALAARILELAQNPALRERLGRAGRATAEQRFERGRLAKEIVPVYRRVAAQAPPNVSEELATLQ